MQRQSPSRRTLPGWMLVLAVSCIGCGGGTDPTPPAQTIPAGGGDAAIDPATDVEMIDRIAPDPSPRSESEGDDLQGGIRLPADFNPDAADQPAGAPPAAEPMKLPENFDAGADAGSGGAGKTLQFADWQGIAERIAQPGRVTVVDFWSTACGPCLREYTNLVALQRRYGDRLRAIGVNLDFDGRRTRPPESYEPAIREFLDEQDGTILNLVSRTPSDEVLAKIDAPSMPVVMVYDDRGELVTRFVDAGDTLGFSYDSHVIPAVESLLGT